MDTLGGLGLIATVIIGIWVYIFRPSETQKPTIYRDGFRAKNEKKLAFLLGS